MVNKDKSEKPQLQSIQEKLRIWIDRYGYDLEDEDGRKEEQNIFRSMSKKIQKYFNKEFKGRIFSEYPKEEIEKANPTTIGNEWRICMARRRTNERPTSTINIIQKINSTDNRIIELQNHIAKLKNEIGTKDQMNEGLRRQLEETQAQLNEIERMCNENAAMVMNAQEWINYFKIKYERRNKYVNELKKKVIFVNEIYNEAMLLKLEEVTKEILLKQNNRKIQPILIILDGIDGVGKTTIVENIIRKIEAQNLKIIFNTFKRRINYLKPQLLNMNGYFEKR
ncbi:hypothetical protein GLOIN_2v1780098 [Rhizophagus irregularis DAOM 181602=DAOM 197198]|nr:hypothetical protein GLOIN_2v1780098 [Rhizophagus irregularis DAOM 181602=DAOM 197198]